MTRILFIYGYGGSPESTFCQLIRDALPKNEFEVLCPVYPQEDLTEARKLLHEFIKNKHIDLIIGTSLGGFITLSLDTDLPRVVINPCMMPSAELPKLTPRDGHPEDQLASPEMLKSYREYEDHVNHGFYNRSTKIIGLFAEKDELLGTKYQDSFKTYYDHAHNIPGGHHGNSEAIPAICKAIQDAIKPILYIDMDNVLADFEGYVKHDLSDEIKRSTKHLDEIPGIFAQFPVVDGAKEALIVLQEKYELFILSTSPWNNPTALQDKQNWLKFHFGNMFHKHVIFTHQKNLCIRPGAWLVDDRPNHGAYLFGDHWLHFGRLGKYKTWNEIKDFLLKQESTIKNNP